MENLNERAANYAAEKTNELLAKAIAQAYEDGYRDGYKQCVEDYNIDLYEDVKFVDLGLPSGLLWSSRYRKNEEGKPLFLTYEEAAFMDIPTEEQVNELVNCCNWDHLMGYVDRNGYTFRQPIGKICTGTNNEYIFINDEGLKFSKTSSTYGIHFWIRDDEDSEEKKSVYIEGSLEDGNPVVKIEKRDADFMMPVLIVRKNKQ
jgi:hypothetical protein